MANSLVHEKGRCEWRAALVNVAQRIRQTRGSDTAVAHCTGATPTAWNASWFLKRIRCAVTGHRRPVATGAAKILSTGVRQELYLCHACDAYSWRRSGKQRSTSWSEVAI
jgi:hypothetical protein